MHDHITLEASHLYKAYHGVPLLSDVSFRMYSGEMLCIMGQNNSFKTTLANILCGLTPCDSGDISINGDPVSISSPYCAHQLGIAVLGETAELCDDLSIAENIFLFYEQAASPSKRFTRYGWSSKKSVVGHAKSFLAESGFDWIDPCDIVGNLGLAEKQIVAFLCALSKKAKCLIIDDVFSALNAYELKQIFRILKKAKQEGMSVLYLSSFAEIPEIADTFIFIQDGKIKLEASREKFKDIDLSLLSFNEPSYAYPKLPIRTGEEIFRCEHVSYKNIVNDSSFLLHEGEILGIVGGAGCGKTTLARVISGHLQKDDGDIYINNKKVHISSVHDANKNGLRLILDDHDFGIIKHLSLAENLIFPHYRANGHTLSPIFPHKYVETSYCLASRLDINYFDINQSPELLSAGNQQKLIVSRGIVAKSNVFILDEPTRGVDKIGKMQIYNLFNNLLREGKGIIIMTSDLNEAFGMCDQILVLKNGRLSEFKENHLRRVHRKNKQCSL